MQTRSRKGPAATGIKCRFAEPSDLEALQRFSKRLGSTEVASWPLSRIALPGATADDDAFPVRRRRLVAVENGEIRAVQNFFEHQLYIDGEPHSFVWPNTPISEGIVDPRYTSLWLALLRYGMSVQPLHLVLGSFGDEPPLGRMFNALRWPSAALHLFIHPIRVTRICRERHRLLQRHRGLAALAAAAEYSGIATVTSLALRAYEFALWRSRLEVAEVDEFGNWADEMWEVARSEYKVLTRRDAAALNRLYRPGDRRIKRLRIGRKGTNIGWLLLATRKFHNDQLLGSLRTCVLIDALCRPDDAVHIMRAGLRQAVADGADICLAWWSHLAWQRAAMRSGFFGIRSGLTLYVPPTVQPQLLSPALPIESCHFSRGDCDGPGAFMEAAADDGQMPFGSPERLSGKLSIECP